MSDVMAPNEGARSEGLVTVEALPPQGQITLRCEMSEDYRAKLSDALGMGVPEQRGSVTDRDRALLWMSPDELLLLVAYDAVDGVMETLNAAFDGWFIAITNVSDARAQFRVSGPHLRDILAKVTATDMAPRGFPVGDVRRSRLAQVAAGYWLRSEDEAQVFVFRSVGAYAFEVLSTLAQPGGDVNFLSA